MFTRAAAAIVVHQALTLRVSRNYFSSRVISLPRYLRTIESFRASDEIASRKVENPAATAAGLRRIFLSSRDTNTANVATIAWKTFRGTWPALLQTTLLSSVRLEIISPRRHSRDDFPLFETARADFCLCAGKNARLSRRN